MITEPRNIELKKLIKSVVKDGWVNVKYWNYQIEEDAEKEITVVRAELLICDGFELDKTIELTGEGKGFVDALWKASINSLKDLAPWFKGIDQFKFYNIIIRPSNLKHFRNTQDTAACELTIKNKHNEEFTFVNYNNYSMNSAAAQIIANILEFFINAQKAHNTLKYALEDAKLRHRVDLVQEYTKKLVEVVKAID